MKVNKKAALSTVAVLGIAALAIGGTIAYFTDEDNKTNTFTVGTVDVELVESYLHRTNAGKATSDSDGVLYWNTTTYPLDKTASEVPSDAGGWSNSWYSDEMIIQNSDYCYNHLNDSGYLYESECSGITTNKYADYASSQGLNEGLVVAGSSVKKMPYVLNTGTVDTYVRTRVLIPAKFETTIDTSMWTSSLMDTGEGTMTKTTNKTVDGIVYNEYAFTYNEALAPEQMTFWHAWGSVGISSSAKQSDIQALVDDGYFTTDANGNPTFGVLVYTDAIQADGFDDATAAFAAYDAQS